MEHNLNHPDQVEIDFLIKWNPRQKSKEEWLAYAQQHGHWEYPRPGKRVACFNVETQRKWKNHDYTVRHVMRVVERTIDKTGQRMLLPEIELEGWWSSLSLPEKDVIQLYCDHGTSEQYHREFKTDIDVERLPSGKFTTNALILGCSMLAYNILRWIGQYGLLGPVSPKRHKAKRRRIKTVMQELMYVAVRLVRTARIFKLVLKFRCSNYALNSLKTVHPEGAQRVEGQLSHFDRLRRNRL
ncbi:MAG: transposase, partial [Reinekea sp.]